MRRRRGGGLCNIDFEQATAWRDYIAVGNGTTEQMGVT